jgi:hypothetical protein
LSEPEVAGNPSKRSGIDVGVSTAGSAPYPAGRDGADRRFSALKPASTKIWQTLSFHAVCCAKDGLVDAGTCLWIAYPIRDAWHV